MQRPRPDGAREPLVFEKMRLHFPAGPEFDGAVEGAAGGFVGSEEGAGEEDAGDSVSSKRTSVSE
jgi:hypothetical protein